MQPPIESEHSVAEELSVKKIIVRQSAVDADDPATVVEANVNFVNALFNAYYLPDEIPSNALHSYHVDYYLAQVANGGHGQFVRNSNWAKRAIDDISDGLRAIHASPYIEIFEDLRRLIEGDAARARAIAEGGGFGKIDPSIKALDNRFFENRPYETLTPANAHWLKSLPELHVVPDDQYVAAMNALRTANPLKDERAAQSQQQAHGFALTDPLKVASKLLCAKAGCLPVTGYGAGDPALPAPDGRKGIAWGVQAGGRQFVMFLFDDAALLCEHYLADGRQVTNELLAQTGQQILSGSLENLESWSHSTTREVARVPRTDVNSAIEAAKTLPVQEAAQKLMAKVNTDEVLQEIFAARRQDCGEWLWMVVTDRRAGVLVVGSERVRLFDMEKQPLAEISMAEITGGKGKPSARADKGGMNARQERDVRIDHEIQEIILRGFSREAMHYGILLSIFLLFVGRNEFTAQTGIALAAVAGAIIYRLNAIFPGYREIAKVKALSSDARWLLNQISVPKLAVWFISGALIGTAFVVGIIVTSDWFKSSLGGVPYVTVLGFPIYATAAIFLPLLIAVVYGANVPARRWAERQLKLRKRMNEG